MDCSLFPTSGSSPFGSSELLFIPVNISFKVLEVGVMLLKKIKIQKRLNKDGKTCSDCLHPSFLPPFLSSFHPPTSCLAASERHVFSLVQQQEAEHCLDRIWAEISR